MLGVPGYAGTGGPDRSVGIETRDSAVCMLSGPCTGTGLTGSARVEGALDIVDGPVMNAPVYPGMGLRTGIPALGCMTVDVAGDAGRAVRFCVNRSLWRWAPVEYPNVGIGSGVGRAGASWKVSPGSGARIVAPSGSCISSMVT